MSTEGTELAEIINGKAFSANLRAQIAAEVAGLPYQPGLAVVLVGDDPASKVYVANKAKQTVEVGMASFEHKLPAETTQEDLLALVRRLNADPKVHGILVQLPLPKHLNADEVIAAISPDKDVDGLTVVNAGRLAAGLPGLVPCTPLGCILLLEDRLPDMTGLNAVVVGRSNLVGKPIAQLLLQKNCTVTMAHSRTKDLPALCRTADILVAAVGQPEMVKGDWIKPGATVIDVGINRVPGAVEGKTKLVGDVAYQEAAAVAGLITPVPGGVGPMTIACLLRNTLTAAKRLEGR
ncbi:bifunctional [5,10-methylene-tetrahydrofolate dehydrogenase/5,10-methylene-tetrahydrofolate cyclohydrolase] [Acidocella aminolytica 101 = DSM 11237]|uniref:Bifunctional protein FolD n=1 Tax=Acidocella aminolytica 101 = DSM 11237 TaxID=1120923 RepID=A0A0D6PL42_9PROT|nr:bifunctional methylenetetrahydrofolate dehydrogenase/methenyltetrahydrofolate cyclohydrolase FolD [Acidocella aminolytica]GAN81484.1 bifunctional [5,10-methylene-tetrahydrofolate dehydrogenase/5,10-methylene-tetrahydrofolate cyclohydrolase] [Acidocella aminolytica 101 = DSM 11237]GBQ41374.1 bifunctional 5,10-methylene-tetrahydrofolate dehydrogenase/ 5,10-methylene-tetrahydrofolate cyclohydrolase [Acidocella aminolytica 101 = DSM 11237]